MAQIGAATGAGGEAILWIAVLCVLLALGGIVLALRSPGLRSPAVVSSAAGPEQLEKWRADALKVASLRKKVCAMRGIIVCADSTVALPSPSLFCNFLFVIVCF